MNFDEFESVTVSELRKNYSKISSKYPTLINLSESQNMVRQILLS